jgi:lipopolysaccharide biosynthesis glycosyltransferase
MARARARASETEHAHVLMAGDSGYLQHVAVCLTSLLDSNPHIEFDVALLVTRHKSESCEKLRRSLARFTKLSLRVIPFDERHLADLPRYTSAETYARFWVDDYFPADVKRVIYLDGDMVIVSPIDELLSLQMGNKLLAAVTIPGSVRVEALGYDPAHGYFNAGVLVINLERWRELGARDLLIAAAHSIADKVRDGDQCVLNYCFHADRVRLDYTWNVISLYFCEQYMNELALPKDEIARVVRGARIVHFNGPSKPWQYQCLHPHRRTYLRYLRETEWRDYQPADYNFLNGVKKSIRWSLGEDRVSAFLTRFRAAGSFRAPR